MSPDSLAAQHSQLLSEIRSKLIEFSGDRIVVVLAPASASELKLASSPYPHTGAFLGWVQHSELGWCGATAFIGYEEELDCCFEFRKLLRRAGGLLPALDTPVSEDGVRQLEPDAARWVSALTAKLGKADFHESPVRDVGVSVWVLKKAWSKSIALAESLGWDFSIKTPVRELLVTAPKSDWLKTGLPPDGWHKTPLCGLLKDIVLWAGTTPKTLRSKNGKRWHVTPWIGENDKTKPPTPYAIYFPTESQYATANQRRISPKPKANAQTQGGKGREGEKKGALPKKRPGK